MFKSVVVIAAKRRTCSKSNDEYLNTNMNQIF